MQSFTGLLEPVTVVQMCSVKNVFLKIFKNTYFYRTPLVIASIGLTLSQDGLITSIYNMTLRKVLETPHMESFMISETTLNLWI